MESAFQPELWHDLYMTLCTSTAALIGLLFVVTSLHLEEILKNPVFRMRVYGQTIYLLILLLDAVAVLIPQSELMIGAELISINLIGLMATLKNIYNLYHNFKASSSRAGIRNYRTVIFIGTLLFSVIGGIGIIKLSNWGIYLVTASYVALLATIVLNAWSIMLGVAQTRG
jgi:hypothetical protein